MARAGGDDPSPPPHPPLHTFTIPLPRIPLQPGQRFTVRIVPGARPGHPNGPPPRIRLVGLRPVAVNVASGQQRGNIGQALRQQQEEARRRAEEEHRRAQLKAALTLTTTPEVNYNNEEGTALLSWQPVTLPAESVAPEYCVRVSEGDRPEPTELCRSHMTSCPVSRDLLLPGHTYHFSVAASANGETGEPSPSCLLVLPALPPSRPLPPKVASRTKNSLVVRWNAPRDNGAAISLYSLQWDQCGGEYVELYSGRDKQFKFNHKFPPGSHACFRLRAQNEMGWSDYSGPLEFSAGAGPPSTPLSPTLTEAQVHSLTLHWTPPPNNGSPITSYCLEMEDPSTGYGFCPVYQGEEEVFTCSKLERVTGYSFRLSSTNDRGTSPFSPPVTYHTLPDLPGSPPPPSLLSSPHPTSLHLTWTPPTDDGGSPIHSFTLQMDCGMGTPLTEVYTGPETSFLAEQLTPGLTYHCRMCAFTVAGRGKWSPIGQFQTPPTKPHPPRELRGRGRPGQTSITLEWDRPEFDGGGRVISYSVEGRQQSEAQWECVATVAEPLAFSSAPSPPPVSPLSHTVTTLSPGDSYCFRVCCRNSVGLSGYSEECVCATSPGPPSSPTHMEVSMATANTASLRWKPPLTHGSVVTGYVVEYGIPGCERLVLPTPTPSHTLRSLLPATQYKAKVKAMSSAGPSEWSPPLLFSTTPSPPAPPSHLSVVTRTPSSLLLAWSVPNTNGAPVTQYCVELSGGEHTSHVTPVISMETQLLIEDLQHNTPYRLRVQAENDIGKGPFSSPVTSSTLPLPPSPPSLSLVSCTPHSLKVAWGKRPSKTLEYVLQMVTEGKSTFLVEYRGSGVNHKVTKLQSNTLYTFRIAASSESGKGAWSDHVTFMTTPTPPPTPSGLVVRQLSGEEIDASWESMAYPLPLTFELQCRTQGQEFQHAYKGPDSRCTLPLRGYNIHECRVRGMAVCTANEKEETLYSSYCQPVQCVCRKLEEEVAEEEDHTPLAAEPEVGVVEGRGLGGRLWNWTSVFVLLSLLSLVVALLLGQWYMNTVYQ